MSFHYHRRSLRLPHYDYSQVGYYFITITTQNRMHLFGEIIDGKMLLNVAGEMVNEWYDKLEEKFQNVMNHDMVIMPNHIHFVIEIIYETKRNNTVMDTKGRHTGQEGRHTGLPLRNTNIHALVGADPCVRPSSNPHMRPNSQTVSNIVQWFKTMTTNTYIQMVKNNILPPFQKRIWQRNFYEHVIRDENDYARIAQYIANNPLTWEDDMLNTS